MYYGPKTFGWYKNIIYLGDVSNVSNLPEWSDDDYEIDSIYDQYTIPIEGDKNEKIN